MRTAGDIVIGPPDLGESRGRPPSGAYANACTSRTSFLLSRAAVQSVEQNAQGYGSRRAGGNLVIREASTEASRRRRLSSSWKERDPPRKSW
jgi:hypothetical protein